MIDSLTRPVLLYYNDALAFAGFLAITGSLCINGFLPALGSLCTSGFLPFSGSSNLVIDPKLAL